MRFWQLTFVSLLFLTLAGCYLEASGCSDNVCFSASEQSCEGGRCDEELYCEDAVNIRQRMAEILTDARNHSRNCGTTSYARTDQVYWNEKLTTAALSHSTDMAHHNFLSHTGSDGSSPDQRAIDAGYNFRRIAENIAGGQETATTVVTAWLDSVEHCANIMNPAIQEIGAACVRDERSDYKTYWTLILASPQTSQ